MMTIVEKEDGYNLLQPHYHDGNFVATTTGCEFGKMSTSLFGDLWTEYGTGVRLVLGVSLA